MKKNAYLLMVFLLMITLSSCGKSHSPTGDFYKTSVFSVVETTIDRTNFNTIHDSVATFIQGNSYHSATIVPTIDPYDEYLIMKQLYNYINGDTPAPNLYCGHRATVAKVIFDMMGIKSRYINFLTSKFDGVLVGHVMLEIFNTETDSWQIFDADMDLYYVLNGKRASLKEVILVSGITPIGNIDNYNFMLEDRYFGAGWVHGGEFYVNFDLYDPYKKYDFLKLNANFFEFTDNNYFYIGDYYR